MLLSVLATKIYFVFVAKGINPTIWDYTSILFLIIFVVAGFISYLKDYKNRVKIKPEKVNLLTKIFIILSILFIGTSILININKKAVVWDAVALYDARAKFLLQGATFSKMVEFSKFDPQNSYYYSLYPPYTSILHYFWYGSGIGLPVGVMYSVMLVFLAIAVYVIARTHLGLFAAILITFIAVSNKAIFTSSLTEYTNLPFTLLMSLGVFLLYEYIEDGTGWKGFYGIALIISSMWIRFLEPLWVGITLAFLISVYYKYRFSKRLILPFIMFVYGAVEYLSWQSFVSSFGSATKIVSFTSTHLLEPLVGIFTGSLFNIFLFFVASWGLIVVAYAAAVYLGIIKNKKLGFLELVLIFTSLIYFAGLYFVSFQSQWWTTLGDSLVRGSVFMLPVSAFIIFGYLNTEKRNDKK